ncbi:MAG: FAD-binding oxidoreductase [Candidatus Bathyarchaeota archaeon]|nr:FAD-binding oxidoreductase [Candidatus Bathyarchaeota archaeon]MDH5779726.1 FAD-binding oxidoreductase [Candidatus Bathyarchaeota archaeon]
MNSVLIKKLKRIVGAEWVTARKEDLLDYVMDETALVVCPKPAADVVLVKPGTTQEIAGVLRFANEWKIPVFPRGGGTGLAGGCVPTERGIVLSLERMDRVIEVDTENLMVVVEAGVTLEKLVKAADESGFLFPPHPGDEAAHVGGLVACNAGGARALRYGVMRNYVKGMEVVLPTGEILDLGGKLLKDVAGYNLMHLIIGSQGTLGVITKVILRLYPKFQQTATLIIPYKSRHDALRTVPRILQEGMIPLAIEYVESELMEKSAKQLGKRWPVKEGRACLVVIVTGNSEEEVYFNAERIDDIAKEYDAIDTLVVQNRRKQNDILSIRSKIYFVLKPFTMDITDVAVPPASMTKFMDALDEIAKKYDMYMPTFGHAGDGNLHTHILMKEAGGVRREDLEKVKKEIYDIAIRLGGTITAEHGIGKIRVKNLSQYSNKKAIEIMKNIKKVFDPNNILNPGTVLS